MNPFTFLKQFIPHKPKPQPAPPAEPDSPAATIKPGTAKLVPISLGEVCRCYMMHSVGSAYQKNGTPSPPIHTRN